MNHSHTIHSATQCFVVLEPSAGTGLLAILAQMRGASLILNELCNNRASLLTELFEDVNVTRHNAEYLDDVLEADRQPSVIIMNPPFSSSPNGAGFNTRITCQHMQRDRLLREMHVILEQLNSYRFETDDLKRELENFYK